ncbi:MAG: hypothetical protein Q8O89_09060 [Nanoarchaeota archaeon]|nr:hypothetical protein [Nanoarchaeota archaeon]
MEVVKEDPDDDKVIECSAKSKSKYIITYDLHLLKLGAYENIQITKPKEMMKILK